ncbi:MAG: DegQ family serine endoprotease [bacterium]|nr:DegQ family serine endoprotease [bacterium]
MNKKRFIIPGILGLCLISVFIGIMIASQFNWTGSSTAVQIETNAKLKESSAAVESQGAFIPGNIFVKIAKEANPAVVYVSSTQVVKNFQFRAPMNDPFRDFFGDDFFNKFFGIPKGDLKRKSLGSGFIISKDGYILTNNHVVKDAEDIKITLTSKNEYEAKIVGSDEDMDIALLKIETKEDLPVVRLGDSDRLEIGEWVVAIGNPFGLEHTVTAGIVSAKWRPIGQGPYDSFIQTDASINPGNSGGPLLNIRGEVVGINTAITAEGQGIGFAIPINMVKEVMAELKEKGKITRGWLGLVIQKVTPDLAKSFGLKENRGALVAEVVEGSPADKAGIKQGDVIISFNGKEINEYTDLSRMAGLTRPGTKVRLELIRDMKKKEVEVEIGTFSSEAAVAKGPVETELGMTLQNITPELADHFDLSETSGVLVTNVIPGSAADKANIRRGDIIIEVNRQKVANVSEFQKIAKKNKKTLLLLIKREDHLLYTAIKEK